MSAVEEQAVVITEASVQATAREVRAKFGGIRGLAMPSGPFADWVTLPEIADSVAFLLDPQSTGIRFAVLPMGR